MQKYVDMTISEIVRSDYRTADVFKKYNINYCCSGKITLQAVCSLGNLDYQKMIEELEVATRNIQICNNLSFQNWKIDFLIDYVINVHHEYLNQACPSLSTHFTNFIGGHKDKFPELKDVQETFEEISALLNASIRHEEAIIFPYIKQIHVAYTRKEPYGNLFVRTLRKPLSYIENEHNLIGTLLKKLKFQTNNFTFPPNACTNHQVLYHKLQAFHDDLHQHIFLEKNFVFPRAIEIESELLQL
ncbi:MAG: DUF542 domain-containing protein [Flavisolibacter sp.]